MRARSNKQESCTSCEPAPLTRRRPGFPLAVAVFPLAPVLAGSSRWELGRGGGRPPTGARRFRRRRRRHQGTRLLIRDAVRLQRPRAASHTWPAGKRHKTSGSRRADTPAPPDGVPTTGRRGRGCQRSPPERLLQGDRRLLELSPSAS